MNRINIFSIKKYVLLTIPLLIWGSCSINPATGKKEFNLMSEKQEIALGGESDPSIVASFGLYQDSVLQQFINNQGQKMAKISHRAHLNFEFKILDSPVVNAFAVPGGYVYFTRGIMAHFNNEAEFAGVLGHEIGHITARHSAKQYSKSMLAQVGFMVGVIASKDFRQYANEAQQALGLLFLKFGRDNESESDRLGVEYSTKIGYDAHEMANFFNTLKRMRGDDSEQIPTFLSTHPDPADRFQKVSQEADKWQAGRNKNNLKIERNAYLRKIDGLIYGEDPRQGYVQNNNFYHPVLKFQFPIPTNWRTANSPLQFQMAPKDGKAMMALSLGQGKTLEEAANAEITNNKLTLVESNQVSVDGLPALAMIADQINQEDPNTSLRVMTYLIEYNGLIYKFNGLSLRTDFSRYKNTFLSTMKYFRKLTDPNKINVLPELIRVKPVTRNTTLSNALKSFKMPSNRFDELAILNGMQLTDQVEKGTLIKIVTKK